MTAAVASAVVPDSPVHIDAAIDSSSSSDDGSSARKRRRQILQSQREDSPGSPTKRSCVEKGSADYSGPTQTTTSGWNTAAATTSPGIASDAPKKTSTLQKKKKPQMRYDPAVPMSKEETAAWRKEQRRKRNRESAAASRQRQRDRIEELEVEVGEWKAKYTEAMRKLHELEERGQVIPPHSPIQQMPMSEMKTTMVSPCTSPQVTSRPSPNLPVSPSPLVDAIPTETKSLDVMNRKEVMDSQVTVSEEEGVETHITEMISRPA